jgi:hypothetical protein
VPGPRRADAGSASPRSSAEFEIEYDNKLVLNRIDLDENALCDALEEAITGAFEQTFKVEENESE